MFLLAWDEYLDSLLIEFEEGSTAYAVELDEDRVVDHSPDPDHPIGVSLHHVSGGVVIDGLPHPEKVARLLGSLGIPTR